MKYLYIKYPDDLVLVKSYDNEVACDEASGFFDAIGCFTALTNKKAYDKHCYALEDWCEECRNTRYKYVVSDTKIRLCEFCTHNLVRANEEVNKKYELF